MTRTGRPQRRHRAFAGRPRPAAQRAGRGRRRGKRARMGPARQMALRRGTGLLRRAAHVGTRTGDMAATTPRAPAGSARRSPVGRDAAMRAPPHSRAQSHAAALVLHAALRSRRSRMKRPCACTRSSAMRAEPSNRPPHSTVAATISAAEAGRAARASSPSAARERRRRPARGGPPHRRGSWSLGSVRWPMWPKRLFMTVCSKPVVLPSPAPSGRSGRRNAMRLPGPQSPSRRPLVRDRPGQPSGGRRFPRRLHGHQIARDRTAVRLCHAVSVRNGNRLPPCG